jgi:hypothetical protein
MLERSHQSAQFGSHPANERERRDLRSHDQTRRCGKEAAHVRHDLCVGHIQRAERLFVEREVTDARSNRDDFVHAPSRRVVQFEVIANWITGPELTRKHFVDHRDELRIRAIAFCNIATGS